MENMNIYSWEIIPAPSCWCTDSLSVLLKREKNIESCSHVFAIDSKVKLILMEGKLKRKWLGLHLCIMWLCRHACDGERKKSSLLWAYLHCPSLLDLWSVVSCNSLFDSRYCFSPTLRHIELSAADVGTLRSRTGSNHMNGSHSHLGPRLFWEIRQHLDHVN